MKTAIQIIRDAFAYVGMVPSGKPLNGNMSQEGLGFLNEVLYRLNSDNYFPFTNNTIDGTVKEGVGIIAPRDDATFVGEKPLSVNKVLYRRGNEWFPLYSIGYDNIFERRCQTTLPSCYAFSNDVEGNGILTFDNENGEFECRVIYNKAIPEMDFNDVLATPPQYEQLLKYGVAIKVCNRYGLPMDKKVSIKEEYDSMLLAIKKNNSVKHEIDSPENRLGTFDDYALEVLAGRHM